jgi:transcriptional regulator with XRE-family HTH domain
MSHPQSPSGAVATIAQRVKELRGRRGWSAAQLGEALDKHGLRWDRFTVSSLESGKRQNVSVQELFALALALDVAPVNLLVPVDDRPFAITPTRIEDAETVRAWVRGQRALPGTDERIYLTEVSVADVQGRLEDMRALLDLGPHPADEPLQQKINREAARMRLQNRAIEEPEGDDHG